MKLHDYLESSYVSTNIANQLEYTPFKQGQTLAVQKLINWQRSFMTFIGLFVLLFGYFKVLLHVAPAPKDAKQLVADLQEKTRLQSLAALKEVVPAEPPAKPPVTIDGVVYPQ